LKCTDALIFGQTTIHFTFKVHSKQIDTSVEHRQYILVGLQPTLPHTQNKISSGIDNWYLNEFFAVEFHLLWTIISYNAWYSRSNIIDCIQPKQMILIWRGWNSSRADYIHPMETIFIQERWISSMMVDSSNYNQPLEMIFNHWGLKSAIGDDNQPLGMIIGRHRWYIVYSRWIICRKWIHLDLNYLPRKISNFHDNQQKTNFFNFLHQI
jgi:hypothetical protein